MDQSGENTLRPRYACTRCNTLVEPTNDLFEVMREWFIVMNRGAGDPFCTHSHFLPVYQDGRKICPGSRSNAQYIEGQPRDDRLKGIVHPDDEPTDSEHERNAKPMREAYSRVQKKFANI
jgi:hypothetical protein